MAIITSRKHWIGTEKRGWQQESSRSVGLNKKITTIPRSKRLIRGLREVTSDAYSTFADAF
jgi:hypothetical protein